MMKKEVKIKRKKSEEEEEKREKMKEQEREIFGDYVVKSKLIISLKTRMQSGHRLLFSFFTF